uniref:Uncharacterized protein n=1 Tax=Rhizophora mucronata TaxID=61149 RepID=A0A2P2NGE0_RHIMU
MMDSAVNEASQRGEDPSKNLVVEWTMISRGWLIVCASCWWLPRPWPEGCTRSTRF